MIEKKPLFHGRKLLRIVALLLEKLYCFYLCEMYNMSQGTNGYKLDVYLICRQFIV